MRSFLIELARLGGRIALEHYQETGLQDMDAKGRGDYVTHVDRRVEDAIASRIKAHYPGQLFLGEETHQAWPETLDGPCWIVDPIDGTTNYIRGIPYWAISIAWCDDQASPRHGVVYDPVRDELFIAERGAGCWLNDKRAYSSGVQDLGQAMVAAALPFRIRDPMAEVAAKLVEIQTECDDFRRTGSAALDLAYVAVGRYDAYWELGIQPWDVAAGELLVRSAGGRAGDLCGEVDGLLARRSILAAATGELHGNLDARLASLRPWLDHPAYTGVGSAS